MRQRWFGHMLPGRKRMATIIITVAAAVLMLSGLGKTVLSINDSFSKSDRLAAISLLLTGKPERALPVTFLDVDDVTRKAWQAQGATPHAALAELIGLAAQSGARGILLDFDISSDQPAEAGDTALATLLREYPSEAPLLMLVRRINVVTSEAVATPYDGDVAGKSNIVWVTTLNDASSDRSVRRIRMWQTVCAGSDGKAYPSVALLTAGALLDGGRNRAALERFLDVAVSRECGNVDEAPLPWPPAQHQLARLPFAFPADPDKPALLRIIVDGQPTPAFWRVRASRLVSYDGTMAAPAGDIDSSPFDGRIAVIGGSYADSGDIYGTALGVMPGAMVLANSIVQARTMVETVPAPSWARNVFAVALLLAFAAIARYFVPLFALIAIAATAVAALLTLTRIYGFETGFDSVAIGLTGFALFKLADAFAHVIMDIPARRWKCILKP